jgi:chemotaxis methyl-accepting protein methylase
VHPEIRRHILTRICPSTTNAWQRIRILEKEALPIMRKHIPAEIPLKSLSVGCSNGVEVYGMRQVFTRGGYTVSDYVGVDLNPEAIETATLGVYDAADHYFNSCKSELAPLDIFDVIEDRVVIRPEARRNIRFLVADARELATNPELTNELFNLVLARNILKYFRPQTQEQVLKEIFKLLVKGGLIVVDWECKDVLHYLKENTTQVGDYIFQS